MSFVKIRPGTSYSYHLIMPISIDNVHKYPNYPYAHVQPTKSTYNILPPKARVYTFNMFELLAAVVILIRKWEESTNNKTGSLATIEQNVRQCHKHGHNTVSIRISSSPQWLKNLKKSGTIAPRISTRCLFHKASNWKRSKSKRRKIRSQRYLTVSPKICRHSPCLIFRFNQHTFILPIILGMWRTF